MSGGAFKGVREGLLAANYRYLQKYVHQTTGVVLDESKQYLLESRLLPVVQANGVESLDDLCNVLRAGRSRDLVQQIVEAMTTHETLFFRDPDQYEALRRTVIPELMAQRAAARRLSFWSAAASFGQEAYSLAMILLDMELQDWRIDILGTDISEQTLERAREGHYMPVEIGRGLSKVYLQRYFTLRGLDWELAPAVRRMVRFERRDLRERFIGLGPFDVIFCRNVLIYFDQETKRQILDELWRALNPNGYLLLGGTESLLNLPVRFQRRSIGPAILYQAI
jgi:chemotaxis protein methyltransferase CheR